MSSTPCPPSCRLIGGPYRTPRCKYGRFRKCKLRGSIRVVELSSGRIPWPIGKRGTHKS
jgi:hypothetical protein